MAAADARPRPERRRTPWRDNIEAMAVAILMAVVLKYFIVEAYKIPTGSMQPTLMGNDETGIHDRILVDKLSYHLRDPKRFEVAVFKYPLDRSKNFVKRIVGVGAEWLRIRHGDLWTRPDERSEWKVLRRPRPVQRETWKALDTSRAGEPSRWLAIEPQPASLELETRGFSARGDFSMQFQSGGPIRDVYNDGYTRSVAREISGKRESGQNAVGDLRVAGKVRALPGTKNVVFELQEGPRRYWFELPGPAAEADAAPRIHWQDQGPSRTEDEEVVAGKPWRLPAGRWVEVGIQNLDDELSLDIRGEVVLALEVPAAVDQTAFAWIRGSGEGADLRGLQVYRDIYYTQGSVVEVFIPAGHYFMLGDNTQDSSDSREWSLYRMSWPGEGSDGQVVQGNNFRGGSDPNPQRGSGLDGRDRIYFRDEWGELHIVDGRTAHVLPAEQAPLVPRELVSGRALVVFWPVSWKYRLWRLKWIR